MIRRLLSLLSQEAALHNDLSSLELNETIAKEVDNVNAPMTHTKLNVMFVEVWRAAPQPSHIQTIMKQQHGWEYKNSSNGGQR